MQRKNHFNVVIAVGVMLVISASIWLGSAVPVSAQCGSQASSCKNCHEVQGEDPVNSDGTAWHQSHAFGDFCYICHAGNSQATDQAEAHTGMVPPLSDIDAACLQCHVDDLEDRAHVYAATLGVDISSGTPEGGEGVPDEGTASTSTGIGLMAPTELEVNDPNQVDYVERYNAIALGEHPVNIWVAALSCFTTKAGSVWITKRWTNILPRWSPCCRKSPASPRQRARSWDTFSQTRNRPMMLCHSCRIQRSKRHEKNDRIYQKR